MKIWGGSSQKRKPLRHIVGREAQATSSTSSLRSAHISGKEIGGYTTRRPSTFRRRSRRRGICEARMASVI